MCVPIQIYSKLTFDQHCLTLSIYSFFHDCLFQSTRRRRKKHHFSLTSAQSIQIKAIHTPIRWHWRYFRQIRMTWWYKLWSMMFLFIFTYMLGGWFIPVINLHKMFSFFLWMGWKINFIDVVGRLCRKKERPSVTWM